VVRFAIGTEYLVSKSIPFMLLINYSLMYRGPGDIRIIKEILDLKTKHPDRVTIILGNRDVNKLRIPFEVNTLALESAPIAYWLYGKGDAPYDSEADKANPLGPDSIAQRMQWMLPKTMGSPQCFFYRSQELGEIGRLCDDAAVGQSFIGMD
jgi:hypothetical protein